MEKMFEGSETFVIGNDSKGRCAGCTRVRVRTPTRTSRPISEFSVLKKLSALDTNKVSGPDGITSWLLKENADLMAAPVADSCFLPFWSVAFQLRGRKRTLHPSRRPHLLVMLTNTWGPFLWPQFFLELRKSLSLTATSSLPSLQKLTGTNMGLSRNPPLCMP